ncbi:thermonuclease family protein [Azotobacter chroococcum]|uniref:SNase-like micrococcal nuclease n=1 Tax=Azotobacter chroococcum NCIMB 8003 TaxID=1328314 RepID=A0A0C4WSX3_9GAMM|nr:thermonuclease family protein [Azotobacter chroococcum]AJE22675.1 SNase-like micrococcal nuclease [Azotobacter chroococcum NCIMB 8003]
MVGRKKLLEAKVVHVPDGDTLKANCNDGLSVVVRLCSIDTPEQAQPYGPEAREALAAMVLNKTVRIEQTAQDRYGRIVGRVFRGRTFVNEEMVRHGHAWVYHDYSREPEFAQLEERARKARQGLWALPKSKRVPPWEWRKLWKGKARPARKGWRIWPWVVATLLAAALAGGAYLWMTGRLDISWLVPSSLLRFWSAGQVHLPALPAVC